MCLGVQCHSTQTKAGWGHWSLFSLNLLHSTFWCFWNQLAQRKPPTQCHFYFLFLYQCVSLEVGSCLLILVDSESTGNSLCCFGSLSALCSQYIIRRHSVPGAEIWGWGPMTWSSSPVYPCRPPPVFPSHMFWLAYKLTSFYMAF